MKFRRGHGLGLFSHLHEAKKKLKCQPILSVSEPPLYHFWWCCCRRKTEGGKRKKKYSGLPKATLACLLFWILCIGTMPYQRRFTVRENSRWEYAAAVRIWEQSRAEIERENMRRSRQESNILMSRVFAGNARMRKRQADRPTDRQRKKQREMVRQRRTCKIDR